MILFTRVAIVTILVITVVTYGGKVIPNTNNCTPSQEVSK